MLGSTRVQVQGELDVLPEPIERVDVLMVEWHPAVAPCTMEKLIGTVQSSGFGLVTPPKGSCASGEADVHESRPSPRH